MHHTLGNGDFHVFKDMSCPISHKQIYLDDPATAPGQIDRVLCDAWTHSRPVYIMIPTDMVPKNVSGTPPPYKTPETIQTVAHCR